MLISNSQRKGVHMKNSFLILIAFTSIQTKSMNTLASDLVDDPCKGAIRCSPGNDGNLSEIEVKKTYTCVLNKSNLDSPLLLETLIMEEVETSGVGQFKSSRFQSGKIQLIVDTIFNSISRVTIVHSGLKSSSFADSTDSLTGGSGNTANLVDLKNKMIYSAHCFTPLVLHPIK